MITNGKGSNRRPTDEKKVAANWPEGVGPKNGKAEKFRKVYGPGKKDHVIKEEA
jgi:hypothetical protein